MALLREGVDKVGPSAPLMGRAPWMLEVHGISVRPPKQEGTELSSLLWCLSLPLRFFFLLSQRKSPAPEYSSRTGRFSRFQLGWFILSAFISGNKYCHLFLFYFATYISSVPFPINLMVDSDFVHVRSADTVQSRKHPSIF